MPDGGLAPQLRRSGHSGREGVALAGPTSWDRGMATVQHPGSSLGRCQGWAHCSK